MLKTSIISILLLLPPIRPLSGQGTAHREIGLPYIQNFSPKEYGAHAQNFAIVQDRRGLMYFGNAAGVLEYDGVSWRLLPLPNRSVVRSLALGEDGEIYVGGQNEFGYLTLNAAGTMQYVSLLNHLTLPADSSGKVVPRFGDVWQIWITTEGVFFFTYPHLFRWTGDELITISPETGEFNRSCMIRDTLFVEYWPGGGWAKVRADSLIPLTHLGNIRGMRFALPFDESHVLMGNSLTGLQLFDGRSLHPFPTEADAFLKERDLHQGRRLARGLFALTTRKGGIPLIDQQGRLHLILTRENGLIGEVSNFIYMDKERGLWLTTDRGLARAEVSGPFSLFTESSGITTSVNALIRHRGRLYAACLNGVYVLQPAHVPGRPWQFRSITGLTLDFWALLSVDGDLLAGGNNGLYRIEETRARDLGLKITVFSLHHSLRHPDRIYVGMRDGLAVLRRKNGTWQDFARVPDIYEEIRAIVEDDQGNLWLGTLNQGLVHVHIPAGAFQQGKGATGIKIKRYDRTNNLPEGTILPYRISGKILFSTAKGLRRFDAASQSFPPDSTFGAFFADTSRTIGVIAEGPHRNVWIHSDSNGQSLITVARQRADGSYFLDNSAFGRMADFGDIYALYFDTTPPHSDGSRVILWLGGPSGIVRYDRPVDDTDVPRFTTLVRRVTVNGDSIIYGAVASASEPQRPDVPRLKYSANALRFEYAALSFDAVHANRYQVFLDGFDKDWSSWTAETRKDYTNLPEATYQFRVRAKNINGQLSDEAAFPFIILPPWYRTWWAYCLYALMFSALVFVVDRVQRRRLLKKERERARRREAELHLKNQLKLKQLEAEKLKELDQMRSDFFANISHEFRTPLTIVLGQIETVRKTLQDESKAEKLDMAMRHARRLQELINQLLDIAKLEAGKMPFSALPGNIVPFLKNLFSAFEPLAQQKRIGMRFFAEREQIEVFFEAEKLEKIYVNLLSNAIKFTPEGGEVSSSLRVKDDDAQARWVEIEVRDSGIGIPEDRLPHIFDRFYQVESGTTRDYEGTGIGLALARELVELHSGTIEVTSKVGLGTVFTVRLPLGSEHLPQEHIATAPVPGEPSNSSTDSPASAIPAGSRHEHRGGHHEHASEQPILLIVEDNPDMRRYIKENLHDAYTLFEARDGAQGIEKAREIIPDLIISDVMMPGIDGYELARVIRAHELTSHIPIIMLTAKAAAQEKLEGLETGVDAYLTKPFSIQELQVRVRKLIEMRRHLLSQRKQPLKITASEVAVTPVDERFLDRLQTIVEDKMEDENFQVSELCRAVGISERQLYRKLKALLGCTPSAFIRQLRLDRAKQLLEKGAGTVSEITFMVGYSNTSAFARAFREAFGKAPSHFLKK